MPDGDKPVSNETVEDLLALHMAAAMIVATHQTVFKELNTVATETLKTLEHSDEDIDDQLHKASVTLKVIAAMTAMYADQCTTFVDARADF